GFHEALLPEIDIRPKSGHPEYLALFLSRVGRVPTGVPEMSLPAASVLDPNRIPGPENIGGRKGESQCGSEPSRLRAHECPPSTARARPPENLTTYIQR